MRNSWTYFSVPFAALMSPLFLNVPAIAQSHTQSLPPETAMNLMQNEAAIQLNTFAGNTEVIEFSSTQNGPMLVGYAATIKQKDSNLSLYCSIDLNEVVQCSSTESDVPSLSDERCGPERPQETVLDLPFTQNLYGTLNDYSVRIYYNLDVVSNIQHLCMNVYDVRNQVFIGAIPARATTSPSITAYYSEQPLNGIDHQVILNPDGRYLFRRSQGTTLLYEGFSR